MTFLLSMVGLRNLSTSLIDGNMFLNFKKGGFYYTFFS